MNANQKRRGSAPGFPHGPDKAIPMTSQCTRAIPLCYHKFRSRNYSCRVHGRAYSRILIDSFVRFYRFYAIEVPSRKAVPTAETARLSLHEFLSPKITVKLSAPSRGAKTFILPPSLKGNSRDQWLSNLNDSRPGQSLCDFNASPHITHTRLSNRLLRYLTRRTNLKRFGAWQLLLAA